MPDPFIGEVRMVAYTYAPRDWAECKGQRIEINQSTSLYSLIWTQFGGDGRTYFNLPNFQGRTPVHPIYNNIIQGSMGGVEWVTLTETTMPKHSHAYVASTQDADVAIAKDGDEMLAQSELPIYTGHDESTQVSLHPDAITSKGGNGDHYNIQPSLVIKFTIAMNGLYPSRQ